MRIKVKSRTWYWLGKAGALASMLFVGFFGFASQVMAADGQRVQIVRDLKSGGEAAERAIRLLARNSQLMPLMPLAQELRAMRDELGISDGESPFPNLVIGDLATHGFTHTLPFTVRSGGQIYSTGEATLMANPFRPDIPMSVTIDRGSDQWVIDQTISKNGNGDRGVSSVGSVTALDLSNPDSPKLRATGSGEWSYYVSPLKELVAENTTVGNTAAATTADSLADEATAGIGDGCPVVSAAGGLTTGEGGVACEPATIGVVVVIIIIIVIVCWILCWILWTGGPTNAILGKFLDLRERLQRALEGGGRPCHVYA